MGEIYVRQEGKGALLGTYEKACVAWAPARTPDDFSMQLLPDDFDRVAPELEVGFRHFPAVGRAGIKKTISGPFTALTELIPSSAQESTSGGYEDCELHSKRQ